MTEGTGGSEKRQILQELQKKLTSANSSLKQVRRPTGKCSRMLVRLDTELDDHAQAVSKRRVLQNVTSRCQLTVQELNTLPDSIPCYEAVGRACAPRPPVPSPATPFPLPCMSS